MRVIEPIDALINMLSNLPNLSGLIILAAVLYRQNSRLLDFQERMMANLTDDVEAIRNDTKRIKDKLNIVE